MRSCVRACVRVRSCVRACACVRACVRVIVVVFFRAHLDALHRTRTKDMRRIRGHSIDTTNIYTVQILYIYSDTVLTTNACICICVICLPRQLHVPRQLFDHQAQPAQPPRELVRHLLHTHISSFRPKKTSAGSAAARTCPSPVTHTRQLY